MRGWVLGLTAVLALGACGGTSTQPDPVSEPESTVPADVERIELPEQCPHDLAIGRDSWVTVGWGICFSTDGVTWESVLPDDELGVPGDAYPGDVSSLTVFGDGYVAVGAAPTDESGGQEVAAVWTSPDGRAWTRALDPDLTPPTPPIPSGVSTSRGSIQSVAEGGPGLVAIGSVFTGTFVDGTLVTPQAYDPAIWTSTDGLGWDRAAVHSDAAVSLNIADVVTTDDGFLAVGHEGRHAAVWTSRDGSVWRERELDPLIPGAFAAVTSIDGRLVAVGAADHQDLIWTSDDGIHWQVAHDSDLGAVGTFSDVAGSRDGLIAVGYEGDFEVVVDPVVLVSSDGITWRSLERGGDAFAGDTWFVDAEPDHGAFLVLGTETYRGDGSRNAPFRSRAVIYRIELTR